MIKLRCSGSLFVSRLHHALLRVRVRVRVRVRGRVRVRVNAAGLRV